MDPNKYEAVYGTSHWEELSLPSSLLEVSIPGAVTGSEAQFVYKVVRQVKPLVVVETGSGKTSLAILMALRDNTQGKLYSIDLPELEGTRSHDSNKGALEEFWQALLLEYPEWDIREKDILKELPQLFDELSQVDIFFHDSRHTGEQIAWEWDLLMGRGKLPKGGLFGSHDRKHKNYVTFMKQLNARIDFRSVGVVRAIEFWERM